MATLGGKSKPKSSIGTANMAPPEPVIPKINPTQMPKNNAIIIFTLSRALFLIPC
jgi:hypothetical protein